MKLPEPNHPIWKLLADVISYIPAVFALLLITNSWDSEWLVIAALAAGAGGKHLLDNLRKGMTDGKSD